MGDLTPDVDLAAEVFSSCKLCSYRPVREEAFVQHEQHTVENHDTSSITEDGSLRVQELGIALSDTLHIQDTCETFGHNLASNENGICTQEVYPLYLDTYISENLTKCQTIVNEGSLNTALHIESLQRLLKDEDSVDACLTDMLATPKLVSAMKGIRAQQGLPLKSAMKGIRAQQGLPLKSKLSVTWAPDVYDPPVTSDSHTVKGCSQRFKYKKDQHKHKHSKSKSSRGSNGDKKHAHRRSTSSLLDPRILRLKALNGGVLSSGLGRSKAEVVDYAVRRQELKIGSSCYMEPLTQVCLPVAEAS